MDRGKVDMMDDRHRAMRVRSVRSECGERERELERPVTVAVTGRKNVGVKSKKRSLYSKPTDLVQSLTQDSTFGERHGKVGRNRQNFAPL